MTTVIFKGAYGGEERRTIRKARDGKFVAHFPGYVAIRFQTEERAIAKAQAHHAFIRVEG